MSRDELAAAARALEAERLRPSPKSSRSDDQALLDAYLMNVLGEGGRARTVQYRALRRIVARLRRESDLSFTGLVTMLVNNEANSRGWL